MRPAVAVVHGVRDPSRDRSGPYEERKRFFEARGWVFGKSGGEQVAVKGPVKVRAACMKSLLNRVQVREAAGLK